MLNIKNAGIQDLYHGSLNCRPLDEGARFDPSHTPVCFDVDRTVLRQGFLRFYPDSIISLMHRTDSFITDAMQS